jgi:hypothetical protein
MSASFLAFVLVLTGLLAVGIARYFPRRTAMAALAGLALWLLYAGAIGYAGLIADPGRRPPGLAFILAPFVAWLVALTGFRLGHRIHRTVPLALLVGLQGFRVVVELFLEGLWRSGLLPEMMTFHGANLDILVGLSAPVVAWLISRNAISGTAVWLWNLVGLLLLANVVARGILTAPGPLQLLTDDHPNRAIGIFPFSYIAGLMVPLAATLHIACLMRGRNAAPSGVTRRR